MLNVMHSGRRVVAALAYNTNFAGEFPVLDALFGTLYRPADRWPAQYGIDDSEPAGYLRQLAWPFRARCAAEALAARPDLVSAAVPAQLVE